jgi:hypothetical protein
VVHDRHDRELGFPTPSLTWLALLVRFPLRRVRHHLPRRCPVLLLDSFGFTTAATLVNELHEAHDEKRLLRLQRQLAGYKLLIID